MEVVRNLINALRALLKSPRALAIFALLYALLLITLYYFIATREATVWQVMVTYAFLVLLPIEFFVLQSAIIEHASQTRLVWRQVGHNAVKLLIVTIPIIVMGLVFWTLLDKFQLHYPAPKTALAETLRSAPKPQPLHWPSIIFATIRFLLFAFALPLATIHLWLSINGRSLRTLFSGGGEAIVKRIGRWISRCLAPDSVATYGLGAILFALIPYAIIFIPMSPKGTKTDFAVFIVRLLLAFCFTLIGWIATIRALAKFNSNPASVVVVAAVSSATVEAAA